MHGMLPDWKYHVKISPVSTKLHFQMKLSLKNMSTANKHSFDVLGAADVVTVIAVMTSTIPSPVTVKSWAQQ